MSTRGVERGRRLCAAAAARLRRRLARAQILGAGGRRAGARAVGGWDEDAFTFALEAARGLGRDPELRDIRLDVGAFLRAFACDAADRCAGARRRRHARRTSADRAAARFPPCSMRCLRPGSTLVAAGERRVAPRRARPCIFRWETAARRRRSPTTRRSGCSVGRACRMIWLTSTPRASIPSPMRRRSDSCVRRRLRGDGADPSSRARECGLAAGDIQHAAVHEPVAGLWRDYRGRRASRRPITRREVFAKLGDLGAAHALFAFALATARARPGERILLAGFGGGCDALVFEMTRAMPGAEEAEAALRQGVILRRLPALPEPRRRARSGLGRALGVRAEGAGDRARTLRPRHDRLHRRTRRGRQSCSSPRAAFPCGPTPTVPSRCRTCASRTKPRAHRLRHRGPAQFHARSAVLVRPGAIRQWRARDDGIHRRRCARVLRRRSP